MVISKEARVVDVPVIREEVFVQTESGHFYVVMHHTEGKTLKAVQVETAHMYQVGKSAG